MKNLIDLLSLPDYQSRLEYLSLKGKVSDRTFGGLRDLNQSFYKSEEWKTIRNFVIVRDRGCDMALLGHEILGPIYVHHMNPITPEILTHSPGLALNPNYLITVCMNTHNRIHYGDLDKAKTYDQLFVPRRPNDTQLW